MERDSLPTRAEIAAKLHAELTKLVKASVDLAHQQHFDRIRQILDELEALDGHSGAANPSPPERTPPES
jgi:hypothetical protein